jgi:WD40 repeat protein
VKLFGDEFSIPPHTIAIDPSEENAIVSLENNRLVALSLTNGDYLLNTEEKPLLMPFHEGAILSCSLCIRKPLIATCGADKTVRVWNYLDNNLEIVKEFTENVYSVSIRSDGFAMLIGFGDKLRYCSVFDQDIKPVQEFSIRDCHCVKFSTFLFHRIWQKTFNKRGRSALCGTFEAKPNAISYRDESIDVIRSKSRRAPRAGAEDLGRS